MSLVYIIDGYNLTNHPAFTRPLKKTKDVQIGLLEFILSRKLTGSVNNRIIIVFDGYPPKEVAGLRYAHFDIIFSKDKSADAEIKKLLEGSDNPKNIAVVSDDKEIKFYAKAVGAKPLGIEEFIGSREKRRRTFSKDDLLKPELTYSQISEINQELAKIWLKE